MSIVELVMYEMEHILRHVNTNQEDLVIDGIDESIGGVTGNEICTGIDFGINKILYVVYKTGQTGLRIGFPARNKDTMIHVGNAYDCIDVERYNRDEGYRFQISSIYSEMELIYHTRSTILHRDFGEVNGIDGIYFGEVLLSEKVEKMKRLEGTPEWRRKRLR